MRDVTTCFALAMSIAMLWIGFGEAVAAQPDGGPGNLVTAQKSGPYQASVGDLIRVALPTQSTPDGIRTLRTEVAGSAVTRVAVVTSDMKGPPGSPYFINAFFKAERPGRATIRVTPVRNVGGDGEDMVVELTVQ